MTPRPARHHFSVSRIKHPKTALAALKEDRQSSIVARHISASNPIGDAPYIDPELYSYGALPPMLNSTARLRDAFGIHPVDSVDLSHPSSLANQIRHKERIKPWDNRSLAMITSISDQKHFRVAAWDSTVRQASVGLWRPPERHRAI